MKAREILRGCEAGQIQSVGHMQVIPLISDIQFPDYVTPDDGTSFSTNGYGKMVFQNETDKTVVIPAHAAYLVKKAAQNHAMPGAGLVKAKALKEYANAQCIQQSQGGYIPRGKYKMMLLPLQLREESFNLRKQSGFQKLWPAITRLNKSFKLNETGHLELFFNKFKQELDQFVAEFETVPRQVGAIILIDGEVVGIEKAPSYHYWEKIWKPLIRDCYGSMVLGSQKTNQPATRFNLDLDSVKNLKDIKNALKKVKDQETDKVREIVNNIIDEEFSFEKEESDVQLTVKTINNNRFIGQIIEDKKGVIYSSIIVKNDWTKNSKWRNAKEFKI